MTRTLTSSIERGRSKDGYGWVRQGRSGRNLVANHDVITLKIWNLTTGAVVISKTSDSDPAEITLADDGSYRVPLSQSDTDIPAGTYGLEVVITLLDGKQYQLVAGTIVVTETPA